MSKRHIDEGSINQIRAAVGNIAIPSSIEEFSSAMWRPFRPAIRWRRDRSSTRLPAATVEVPWYWLGHQFVDSAIRPSRFLNYPAGDYYIQDAGSLLALAVAGADQQRLSGKLVCDLCAAPGGKASALVEAVGDDGFVLANEVIHSRLGPLKLNLARTGSDRYAISSLDPIDLADQLPGVFDLVLVDAPCSGQALLGRGKQRIHAISEKQIQHSAQRQHRILDAALRLVQDGGTLVYSTCTFAEAENEAQVARLLATAMAVVDPIDRLAPYQSVHGCYRLWPHQHSCAGSFASAMQVKSREAATSFAARSHGDPSSCDELEQWYEDIGNRACFKMTDSAIFGWPDDVPAWVPSISHSGPEIAHRVGKVWRPAHAGALRRVDRCRGRQSISVDAELASRYLRGESIPTEGQDWAVVRWCERPLGWIRMRERLGKNHLPKSARMQGNFTTSPSSCPSNGSID